MTPEMQKRMEELAEEYHDDQAAMGELNSRHMDDLSGAFQAGFQACYELMSAEVDTRAARLIYERDQLKADNEMLSKYCGEVKYWQNRAEDLSEENARLTMELEKAKTHELTNAVFAKDMELEAKLAKAREAMRAACEEDCVIAERVGIYKALEEIE